MIITIDGPAASGKSTISRMLAKELNYFYIYSGILYRAFAYLLLEHEQVSLDQLSATKHAYITTYLMSDALVYDYDHEHNERIFFDGQDITPYLFNERIDQAASLVSMDDQVRKQIVGVIRRIVAQGQSTIVDGRDAGTHIFPEAVIKFYLTARPEIRAERWQKAQEKKGVVYTHAQALAIITQRDDRDSTREHAPLVIPQDAIMIDSSDMTVEQTNHKMFEIVLHTLAQRNIR